MRPRPLLALLLLTGALPFQPLAQSATPEPPALSSGPDSAGALAPRCVEPAAQPLPQVEPALPLPALVSGRVGFFMTWTAADGTPLRSFSLGDPDRRFPLMSMYKTVVVHAALQQVDQGRWTLNTPFTTTAATRSIERYPAGTNTLLTLADRSLRLSDNTAADLLQLGMGPEVLSREIAALSPCTTVLLTGKAIFASLAGLNRGVLGDDLLAGARTYAAQSWEARLKTAGRLIAGAQRSSGPQVEAALVHYFGTPGHERPTYRPDLELLLQNTSTPRAWTQLLMNRVLHSGLEAQTDAVYQRLLGLGCCHPATPVLPTLSWAAKAGSGWRQLALSGVIRLPDGTAIGYSYFNDRSDVQDSEQIERQIRPLVAWIEQNALQISRGQARERAKLEDQVR